MKIMFLVLALVLATVNGGLLLQDDEVDDALLAVDETDEVDDALAPVDALENRRLEDKNLKGNLVNLKKILSKGHPFFSPILIRHQIHFDVRQKGYGYADYISEKTLSAQIVEKRDWNDGYRHRNKENA